MQNTILIGIRSIEEPADARLWFEGVENHQSGSESAGVRVVLQIAWDTQRRLCLWVGG
jgi:hypothetical protein